MFQVGKINALHIIDILPYGATLGHEDSTETVLLPASQLADDSVPGDTIEVFIYHDGDGVLVATTDKPSVMLGQCGYLPVVAVKSVGAFVDWGLPKDLLIPVNQQDVPMQSGKHYMVYVYQDRVTGRLAGSTKLRDYLSEDGLGLEPNQQVSLRIYAQTDMGYKAIIDGTHLGLLFKDEVFKPIKIGQTLTGFVRRIREDGRIDLSLQRHDPKARGDLGEQIIAHLQQNNGSSFLTDKADARAIYAQFNVSKSAYKKALGALYKQKRIQLSKTEIKLAD